MQTMLTRCVASRHEWKNYTVFIFVGGNALTFRRVDISPTSHPLPQGVGQDHVHRAFLCGRRLGCTFNASWRVSSM